MVLMKLAVHLFQLIFHLVLNPYFLFYVSICYSHVICTLADFGLMSFFLFFIFLWHIHHILVLLLNKNIVVTKIIRAHRNDYLILDYEMTVNC